jgi:hypothetical protein
MTNHKIGDLLLAHGDTSQEPIVLGIISKYYEQPQRYDILWTDDYNDGSGLCYGAKEIDIFKDNLREYIETIGKTDCRG